MSNAIYGKTREEITYNCMMYRLKRPNEWDEHCAGSLTLKGRVETAKWAYNYIQQLERERDAAVRDIEHIAKDYGVCFCDYCKYGDDEEECAKRSCNGHRNDFEWRGAQEVE